MMKKNSRVAEMIGIEYPIFSAAMSWITDAKLVAAVSANGGCGILGPNAGQTIVATDPKVVKERMRLEIEKVKSLTDKPFGAELLWEGTNAPFGDALAELYIENEMLKVVVCQHDVPAEVMKALRDSGKILLQKEIWASVDSVKRREQEGYDGYIVAGVDCGGHSNRIKLGTFTVVRMACDNLSVPVIAAGGIHDRIGVQAAGLFGAEGIYVGTRFNMSEESPLPDNVKQKMVEMTTDDCVQIDGQFGPVLSYKTPDALLAYEMMEESHKNYANWVHNTYSHGYRTGMRLGLFDQGIGHLDVSAAIGQMKEILSVKDIMDEFKKGFE